MFKSFHRCLVQVAAALTLVACGGGDPDMAASPQSIQVQRSDSQVMAKALGASVVDATSSPLVDQAVNLQDAIAILKMIVGLDVNGAGQAVTPYQLFAADFDGNGKVELADAIGILKRVVGLDSPSPKWLFFNTAGGASIVNDRLIPGLPPELALNINGLTAAQVSLGAILRGDVVGSAFGYTWTLDAKPTGSVAVLHGATAPTPAFNADLAGDYVATLKVNDSRANFASATATLTVLANAVPVANAGAAQGVWTGTTVTLNGTASSDANGDPLTYAWTLASKPSGSAATLIGAASAKPSFTADVAGTYVAALTVNDGKVNSSPASISVTATMPNVAPVANAGMAKDVVIGNVVTLDGSASSDANGDQISYDWVLTSKPVGSGAILKSSNTAHPTFTVDLVGIYVASLVVSDGKINSAEATVIVTTIKVIKDCSDCPEMLTIPSGNFAMGSSRFYTNEQPVHTVKVPTFLLSRTEVTQGQWQAVMGSNPSAWRKNGVDYPVDCLSWNDAQEFARILSQKTGKNYRLPSEAEWEYSARAGSSSEWNFGDDESQLGDYAWFKDNRWLDRIVSVAQKKPNAFGLHDMHGNVWERVQDVWHDNYQGAPVDGSAWVSGGDQARPVVRGGNINSPADYTRSSFRIKDYVSSQTCSTGLRIARSL